MLRGKTMNQFLHGHAAHPDWPIALALAVAQIEAQRSEPGFVVSPTLGWVYFTEHYVPQAEALLAELQRRWPGVEWVGASGVGIAAAGVEYFQEPALTIMLTDLAAERFRVFSGTRSLAKFAGHTAQVHADPGTPDLAELIQDMSGRVATGYLFGGVASGQKMWRHVAGNVLSGGLSGVAFDANVALVSRVTQGCQPVGPVRRITAVDRNLITHLDGEPALDCLLRDLSLDSIDQPEAIFKLRETMVGLSSEPAAGAAVVSERENAATFSAFDRMVLRGAFGADTCVRHLIGFDAVRRCLVIGDTAELGAHLAFCQRNMQAARRDLMRICAEVREEVEPENLPLATAMALKNAGDLDAAPTKSLSIAGAIYVSCAGRGGVHFGAPSAELSIVRHALGDVPLVGFFAAGEIARQHLYGYTGVLTVFRH
jgi:small ligand-binding sensory domain FIST